MNTKTRRGLVEDKELYLSVSGVGYSKEELNDVIDKFDIDTPEGTKGAISALKDYMKSSEDDAVDVIGKLKLFGSREGSCGHCKRPDNLPNIASYIVTGMDRKIGEPSREGSRKGVPAFATGNSGKLMNDFKNVLNNDKVSTKLQKTFGTQDQKNQAILKEHSNNQAKIDRQNKVDQLRNGSRKGSSLWTLKGSERQELYNRIDSKLKSEGQPWDYVYTVTGKDHEDSAYSAFAEMPENQDWINGLILEITRDRNNY